MLRLKAPNFGCALPPFLRSIATIGDLVEAKTYHEIPDHMNSKHPENPNHFSFLCSYSNTQRTLLIDAILQSWIPLRPKFRLQPAYESLLSYALQSPNPLPLALPILQQTLRSGVLPVLQTQLLISSAWIRRRREIGSVGEVIEEMRSIGYEPDCGTCNYVINSLCSVDRIEEGINVLKGIGRVGCAPDSGSYGIVVSALCGVGKGMDAADLVKEMVGEMGLFPRRGTVLKVVAALRANRELESAVELIELLEREGCCVGFKVFECLIEGCLECKQYVLAGKLMVGMTERGFIPYIKTRQKVVDGLAALGNWEFACFVRQRLAELCS